MYFAAIDLGATYIKSCRIDSNSFEVSRVEREKFPDFESSPSQPARRVVDFDQILKQVSAVLARQLSEPGCAGLSFSNQMHGFVLMDGERAISPFHSWQDLSAEGDLPEIRDRVPGFNFLSETGEYLRAGFPLAQLYHLKKAAPGQGAVCDLGTAVIRALTGSRSAGPGLSNAAAYGALAIEKFQWHQNLIESLGLDDFTWPEVSGDGVVVGKYSGIPVFESMGDQQVSLLGANLNEENQANFNIATGSQASVLARHYSAGDHQVRPFFGGRFLKTVTHIPAGRALNILLRAIFPRDDLDQAWSKLGPAIDREPYRPSTLNIDLAQIIFVQGYAESLAKNHPDPVSLMRTAFDALSHLHVNALKRIVPQHEVSTFTGSGGILRKSAYLRAALESRLNRPLVLSPQTEDALEGHARRFRSRS